MRFFVEDVYHQRLMKKHLGATIREWRDSHKPTAITQDEFARMLSKSPSFVTKLEASKDDSKIFRKSYQQIAIAMGKSKIELDALWQGEQYVFEQFSIRADYFNALMKIVQGRKQLTSLDDVIREALDRYIRAHLDELEIELHQDTEDLPKPVETRLRNARGQVIGSKKPAASVPPAGPMKIEPAPKGRVSPSRMPGLAAKRKPHDPTA